MVNDLTNGDEDGQTWYFLCDFCPVFFLLTYFFEEF